MEIDFEKYKEQQFCDNPKCPCFNQIGKGNIKVQSRKHNKVYCNICKNTWVITKGTFFFNLRKPISIVLDALSLASSGMSLRSTAKHCKITTDSLKDWIVLAGNHVEKVTNYLQQDMHFDQAQIDEFWSFIQKKEHLTESEIIEYQLIKDSIPDKGDCWTFVNVLPENSFIQAVHSGRRTVEQAKVFISKVKKNSDGKAPLFMSDDWFYEEALYNNYCTYEPVPYKGRGRYPHPKRVIDSDLKYAQIVKERVTGRLKSTSSRVVFGDILAVKSLLKTAERNHTINTCYVESRNGAYRKDCARLIRKTKCHSKKGIAHNGHILLITGVYNYVKVNESFNEIINPDAKRFEVKYKKYTPAMKAGIVNKIFTLEELLMTRPLRT